MTDRVIPPDLDNRGNATAAARTERSSVPRAVQSYALISPCRDEAEFLRRTLDSIVAQSVRPAVWVIVDDGSTDETPEILTKYAAEHQFIRIVRREDRGRRSVGPGVIEAFYDGLATIDLREYDFLCKFDADIEVGPRYFEILIDRMNAEPRLATCSGKVYLRNPDGSLLRESMGDEMSIGASKFYRTDAFEQIGGFVREVMWDGLDCHRCRLRGWLACSWDEPELRMIQQRPTGSSDRSILRGRMRHGFGQYFMGTGLVYMTAAALYRATKQPLVVGGLMMWWGYVWSALRRQARYPDREFRRFLRRYQRLCLWHGKARATQMINKGTFHRWQPGVRR